MCRSWQGGSAQDPPKMRIAQGKLVMESQNKLVPHEAGGGGSSAQRTGHHTWGHVGLGTRGRSSSGASPAEPEPAEDSNPTASSKVVGVDFQNRVTSFIRGPTPVPPRECEARRLEGH